MAETPPDWVATSFEAYVENDGSNTRHKAAGWVKGLWALDFRVFDLSEGWDEEHVGGWMLTHLPTGRRTFGILAPLDEALAIADGINAMADWDFPGEVPPPSFKGIKQRVEDAYPHQILTNTIFSRGPFMVQPEPAVAQYKKERGNV